MRKIKPLKITEQPKRIRDFIDYVRKVCDRHNIHLYLGRGSRIIYPAYGEDGWTTGSQKRNKGMGMGCFFEDEDDGSKLMVATGRPRWQWLGTLAHELSHVMQWLECDPTYCGTEMLSGNDACEIVDLWLEGKEYRKATIKRAVQLTVDCELDNEKRTVRLIKKFKLPIDVKQYIRAANSYLFFHQVMFENRTWYNKDMFSARALKHMPDHFLPDESYKIGKMPREYVEYLEGIVINKTGWSWAEQAKTNKRKAAK